jgi:cysteinyl-tRNA synthetase
LKALGGVLGLLEREPKAFLQAPSGRLLVRGSTSGEAIGSDVWIEKQKELRSAAKQAKNFAEADRIRNDLLAQGIILEDKPGGITVWRRA